MIICRTPFRISFFGGGSDYPAWTQENSGAVLSTTINRYCYLTCRYLPPFFPHKLRVVYSKIELCNKIEEIKHPAVREALKLTQTKYGVEIHHDGDLPARSGMGSSSSFAVGIINTLLALQGKMKSKKEIAQMAIDLEQNHLKENVGSQDQIAAAYGGINLIELHAGTGFNVRPVILSKNREEIFRSKLLLFFTGISRNATEIASSFLPGLSQKKNQILRSIEMVGQAESLLSQGNIHEIGPLLNEAWQLKRSLGAGISNSDIDDIYQIGIKNGATGGKILGAGGGGFLLFFAEPENHEKIRQALSKLVEVPFEFERGGSQIMLFENHIHYEQNPL